MRLENILDYGRYLFAISGTAVITLLGGWDKLLQALILFVVVDYITGVIAAYFDRRLSSEAGGKGIIKKFLVFCVIAIAAVVDKVAGTDQIFRTLAIMFYLSNEGLSIIENLGKCGVPVPSGLKDAITKLNGPREEVSRNV